MILSMLMLGMENSCDFDKFKGSFCKSWYSKKGNLVSCTKLSVYTVVLFEKRLC